VGRSISDDWSTVDVKRRGPHYSGATSISIHDEMKRPSTAVYHHYDEHKRPFIGDGSLSSDVATDNDDNKSTIAAAAISSSSQLIPSSAFNINLPLSRHSSGPVGAVPPGTPNSVISNGSSRDHHNKGNDPNVQVQQSDVPAGVAVTNNNIAIGLGSSGSSTNDASSPIAINISHQSSIGGNGGRHQSSSSARSTNSSTSETTTQKWKIGDFINELH
jgi:hypothetical protein